MNTYRYKEDRSGGILITRSRNGIDEAEVYLQPGDDANSLRPDLEAAEKLPDGRRETVIQSLLDQYDDVMQPIEQTRGLDADLVAHLQEYAKLDQGISRMDWLRDAAMRDPERAERWATELRSNPHGYAEQVSLEADNIRGVATQIEQGVARMKSPELGDLVKFTPHKENVLTDPDFTPGNGATYSGPFSGRVVDKLSTAGGDFRYHLRAESGPDKGVEARVYGRDGVFESIGLEQAYGFDRDNPERIWDEFRQSYTQIPEKIDKLIEATSESFERLHPEDYKGYIELRKSFLNKSSDALGIIPDGEHKGEDRHFLLLKNAGIDWTESRAHPEMLKYRETFNRQVDRIREFEQGLDRQYKDRLSEHGKEVLRPAEEGVPMSKEREAAAVFWKHGIVGVDEHNPHLKQLLDDIEQKNLRNMLGLIGHNSQNPASQEVFERMTVITLGKTQKERVAQLEAWAGPEKVAALKEAKKQREAEIARNRLAAAYKKLDGVRVQIDEPHYGSRGTVSGQVYLQIKVSQGTDRVYAQKQGKAITYCLRNLGTDVTSGIRAKEFNDFARATLAISPDGDVRKALGSIGIHTPDKVLSDFLRERQQVRSGVHPDYPGGDSVWDSKVNRANTEKFERRMVNSNKPLVQGWVKELREHPRLYGSVVWLPSESVHGLADRLEKGVEQNRTVVVQRKRSVEKGRGIER